MEEKIPPLHLARITVVDHEHRAELIWIRELEELPVVGETMTVTVPGHRPYEVECVRIERSGDRYDEPKAERIFESIPFETAEIVYESVDA